MAVFHLAAPRAGVIDVQLRQSVTQAFVLSTIPLSLSCSAGIILKFLISEHRTLVLVLYQVVKIYSGPCPHPWKLGIWIHSANSPSSMPVPELGLGCDSEQRPT